ncbi:MAG: DUF4258 domain-containing protein [Rhabdaerophilum sp.]
MPDHRRKPPIPTLYEPQPSPLEPIREVLLVLKGCVQTLRQLDERKYSPDQPRWPEGDPRGGRWRPKEVGEGESENLENGFGIAPDGTLIEPVAECTGISGHALRRMQERGISFDMITDALTNPLRIVPQANGNTLYIGARARVVLSPKGWMVTCM